MNDSKRRLLKPRKSDATHYSVNGITGHPARYYYLQDDGVLFRWSVIGRKWVTTGTTLIGLVKLTSWRDEE